MTDSDVKQLVRDRYGQEARRVLDGSAASGAGDAVSGDLYGGAATPGSVPAQCYRAGDPISRPRLANAPVRAR